MKCQEAADVGLECVQGKSFYGIHVQTFFPFIIQFHSKSAGWGYPICSLISCSLGHMWFVEIDNPAK